MTKTRPRRYWLKGGAALAAAVPLLLSACGGRRQLR